MNAVDTAIVSARQVRDRAYAPYSNFQVGATLITASGQQYIGCNVENAVYGLTQCAERSAISNMIADNGKQRITDVIITSSSPKPCPPCGACRQAIAEFGNMSTRIHCITDSGDQQTFLLKDLIPECFNLNEMES